MGNVPEQNESDNAWKQEYEKKQASVTETDSSEVQWDIEKDPHVENPNPKTKKRTNLKPGPSRY